MSNLSLVLMFSILVILSAATPRILAVQYTVTMATTNTVALARFNKEVGVHYTQTIMAQSTKFIWNAFNQSYMTSVTHVTLYITDMAHRRARAITTGDNINVSASYIERFGRGNLTTEFEGIVYRQMTRVWQFKGTSTKPASESLLSGIDDFIRLEACLVPTYFAEPGDGHNWDDKRPPGVTAWFLKYCDHFRPGIVSILNQKMKKGYNDSLFGEILRHDVDQFFWDQYLPNAFKFFRNYKCR